MERVIALAGNPNCGKTTLFNRLTGSSAHVGNWAGVTVEKRSGYYRGIIGIVDLPGNYSLCPYSPEEKVASDYINSKKADVIINIVDATCIERSMYLTTQLLETGTPMVVALNMADEAKRRGISIDTAALSRELGVAVIPISAAKDANFDRLINAALKMKSPDFVPLEKRQSYAETAAIRYRFIENHILPHISSPRKMSFTALADRLLLNRFLALPIFAAMITLMFWIVFGPVGSGLKQAAHLIVEHTVEASSRLLIGAGVKEGSFVLSLICDGILSGVGEVLSFLPQIMLLFSLISFIEASGYMARAAFLTDRVLSRFSLTGKSVVPLLMGFGCSVPAIMSSRTVENADERRLTAVLIPFMPCSAKLPVFVMLSSAVIGERYWPAVAAMYVLGAVCAVTTGSLSRRLLYKGLSRHFMIELPEYRLPTLRNLLATLKEKVSHFLTKAGTVILISTVCMWLLLKTGLLEKLGAFIAPIFAPLGFGSAEMTVSVLSGFIAKEMVVSTLALFGGGSIAADGFTVPSMLSFLSYCLISPPCMAACAALIGELKSKKLSLAVIAYYLSLSWLVSFIVYRLALLIL